MTKFLSYLPSPLLPLAVYYVLFLLQQSSGGIYAFEPVLNISLMSGALLSFSPVDLTVILGLVCLFFEVIKSATVNKGTIVEHMLSMLVFIGYLVLFLFEERAGNPQFLQLTLMALVDVMAGFSITIMSARRDISVGHGAEL